MATTSTATTATTRRSSATSTAMIAVAFAVAAAAMLPERVDGHIAQVFPISRQYSHGPVFKAWWVSCRCDDCAVPAAAVIVVFGVSMMMAAGYQLQRSQP